MRAFRTPREVPLRHAADRGIPKGSRSMGSAVRDRARRGGGWGRSHHVTNPDEGHWLLPKPKHQAGMDPSPGRWTRPMHDGEQEGSMDKHGSMGPPASSWWDPYTYRVEAWPRASIHGRMAMARSHPKTSPENLMETPWERSGHPPGPEGWNVWVVARKK